MAAVDQRISLLLSQTMMMTL